MTAAIAMIMIMSTVLCSGKKKSSKKRKDFNFARKTLISSETKEEVKKDAPKNELKGKENLLASNYPTGENLKKMHDDMKRKKAHNNAPLIQLTRMTAAIAMIMIMSTVLCSGKKKSSKKRKDFNFARKTLISSETKEE
ncbi:hypothetical protein WUBG_14883, partial [Wuchereria bancrofti]